MAPARILVPDLAVDDRTLTITGAPLRHLRALRLRAGDRFLAFDGSGRECTATLSALERQRATATIESVAHVDRESPLELELAPAVLKGARMDLVFEKGTELGVTRFRPTVTARVQGHRDQTDRWRRIVAAAAEQSGRTRLPIVEPPRTLATVLADAGDALLLLAFEGETGRGLEHAPDEARRLVAIIGPEGGLTADEVSAATTAGAYLVGLGPRLLRAETAAVVMAALAQSRWGDG